MNDTVQFTDEILDVLREVTNIGMGMAGNNLAEALGQFVTLQVPTVRLTQGIELYDTITPLLEQKQPINLVRQGFFNELQGESILIFNNQSFHTLVEVLGYRAGDAQNSGLQKEMLLDLGNSINSACLQGFSDQLGFDIHLSSPNLSAFDKNTSDVSNAIFCSKALDWPQCLLLDIQFHMKSKDFSCEILILFDPDSLRKIHKAILGLLGS